MSKYTKKYILMSVLSLMLMNRVFADTLNPCEYMNMTANAAQRLDTGSAPEDSNFRHRYEDNNREMILACQEYQIKLLHQQKADIDRDNF